MTSNAAQKKRASRARTIRSRLGGLRDRIISSIEGVSDAATARALARRPDAGRRQGSLLLAAPGDGSIGDEAMHEAYVRGAVAPVTVVVRRSTDLLVKGQFAGARVVEMPSLFYGSFFTRRRELGHFLHEARGVQHVGIIGADVMDGVYRPLSSVRRFRLASAAASVGANARILGFSWNSRPSELARRAMRSLPSTVTLCVRDSVSLERIKRDGARNAIQVAALAFLTPAATPVRNAAVNAWVEDQRRDDRVIVIVNANPRLEARFPGMREQYLDAVRSMLANGVSVLLLPHDSRATPSRGLASEEQFIAGLAEELGEMDNLLFVSEVQSPEQVVAIARQAELVLTGRMHLAILAACAGVPSLGLEYQDKFRGLYLLQGYDGTIPSPTDGQSWSLAASLERALSSRAEWAAALSESLPGIRELASVNLGAPAA